MLVHQHQGYATILQGPPATGKSESVKELARKLGYLVYYIKTLFYIFI